MGKKFLASIGAGLIFSGCSVLGIRTTPEPDYQVIEKAGNKEVRYYPSLILAQVFFAGSYQETSRQAFRILAAYIFGKNEKKETIAMTAPVLQRPEQLKKPNQTENIGMTAPVFQTKTENGWQMAFVMPKRYTLENLPKPLNEQIKIVQSPPKKIVALRYSGLLSETKINKRKMELMAWVREKNFKSLGEPFSAGYDPPWTLPFVRRNEIQVEIE